ncbi:MAG: hypothetical protein EBZ48_14135, partial [Proteobacteria bacterium]|nr:hypothetical protein [Pseudomonadota bacterium]
NEELQVMQGKLVERERAAAVNQLVGAVAHTMGQPLSAIMLNLHLIKQLTPADERYRKALGAIQSDAKRLVELLEQIKRIDSLSVAEYFGGTAILDLAQSTPQDSAAASAQSLPDNVVPLRPTPREK